MNFAKVGVLVVVSLLSDSVFSGTSSAQDSAAVADTGNRGEDRALHEFEVKSSILVKLFYIAMRDKSAEKLQKLIDPTYIERHGLGSNFETELMPVDNVYKIKASRDRKTLLCHLLKDDGKLGVVVLNVVQRGPELFIVPPEPPKDESKITPWLVHAKLESK